MNAQMLILRRWTVLVRRRKLRIDQDKSQTAAMSVVTLGRAPAELPQDPRRLWPPRHIHPREKLLLDPRALLRKDDM